MGKTKIIIIVMNFNTFHPHSTPTGRGDHPLVQNPITQPHHIVVLDTESPSLAMWIVTVEHEKA